MAFRQYQLQHRGVSRRWWVNVSESVKAGCTVMKTILNGLMGLNEAYGGGSRAG